MASKLFVLAALAVSAYAGVLPPSHYSGHEHLDLSSHNLDLAAHSHVDLSNVHHQDLSAHDLSAYAHSGHGDHEHTDYHAHPRYEFSYDVKDDKTGDEKSHQESRDGDAVRGSYSVVDPDGHKRTVDYTADKHSGFQATVRREKVANFNEDLYNHYQNGQHAHAFEGAALNQHSAHSLDALSHGYH